MMRYIYNKVIFNKSVFYFNLNFHEIKQSQFSVVPILKFRKKYNLYQILIEILSQVRISEFNLSDSLSLSVRLSVTFFFDKIFFKSS